MAWDGLQDRLAGVTGAASGTGRAAALGLVAILSFASSQSDFVTRTAFTEKRPPDFSKFR